MEIERLVKDGVKEVMLLDKMLILMEKHFLFCYICAAYYREIDKIDGLESIRFMTPHRKDLSDEN